MVSTKTLVVLILVAALCCPSSATLFRKRHKRCRAGSDVAIKGGVKGSLRFLFQGLKGHCKFRGGLLNDLINIKVPTSLDASLGFIMRLGLGCGGAINLFIPGLGDLIGRMAACVLRIIVCILGIFGDRGFCGNDFSKYIGISVNGITSADLLIRKYKCNDARGQINAYINKYSDGKGIEFFNGSRQTILQLALELAGFLDNPKNLGKSHITNLFSIIVTLSGTVGNSYSNDLGKTLTDDAVSKCNKFLIEAGCPSLEDKKANIIIVINKANNDDQSPWAKLPDSDNKGNDNNSGNNGGNNNNDGNKNDNDGNKNDNDGNKNNDGGNKNDNGGNKNDNGGNKNNNDGNNNNNGGNKNDNDGNKNDNGGNKNDNDGNNNNNGGNKNDNDGNKNDNGGNKNDNDGNKNNNDGNNNNNGGNKNDNDGNKNDNGGNNNDNNGNNNDNSGNNNDNSGNNNDNNGNNNDNSGNNNDNGGNNDNAGNKDGNSNNNNGNSGNGNTGVTTKLSGYFGVLLKPIRDGKSRCRVSDDYISFLINLKTPKVFVDVANLVANLGIVISSLVDILVSGLGNLLGRVLLVLLQGSLCSKGSNYPGFCSKNYGQAYGISGNAGDIQGYIKLYNVQNARQQMVKIIHKRTKGKGVKNVIKGGQRTVLQSCLKLADYCDNFSERDAFSNLYIELTKLVGVVGNSFQKDLGDKITSGMSNTCDRYVSQKGYQEISSNQQAINSATKTANSDGTFKVIITTTQTVTVNVTESTAVQGSYQSGEVQQDQSSNNEQQIDQ